MGVSFKQKNPSNRGLLSLACPENRQITYRLQACKEPVRSANPYWELTVPEIRALLLVLVLSMYCFRPLVDLLPPNSSKTTAKRTATFRYIDIRRLPP